MYSDLHVMICSLKTLRKKIAYMEANTKQTPIYKWGGFVGVTSPYRETPHTAAIVMPIGPISRFQKMIHPYSISNKENYGNCFR